VIALKLPLGLLALALLGGALVLLRRARLAGRMPLTALAGFSLLFLLVLGSGSAYGGVRHALPLFPMLALLGGVAVSTAASPSRRSVRWVAAVALAGAAASALPVVRPWEYYNELIGGPENAYLYFADEGVDLGQHEPPAAVPPLRSPWAE